MSAMQILELALSEVTPYWNNPRNNANAVQGVKESIANFGFLVPIVLDSNKCIITGHTRYLAAKELGYQVIPAIIASDLTPDKVKAFRLADNRVSENATWDETRLAQELRDLQELGIDLSFTGFSKDELDCLCGEVTADCLDDLSVQNVCGQVSQAPLVSRNSYLVTVGTYKFQVPKDAYKKWEESLMAKYPKRDDLVKHLMVVLGFTHN